MWQAVADAPKSALWTILGILAELMLTAAAICALYIAWQMWWTGVQSEHNQIETRQSVSWSDPGKSGNVTVAKAQQGDLPVQPQSATEGELIAQIYIPRFGSQWQRNLVEGTDLTQLNKHGLGHYTDSQMPGQVGNFAFAGHRNGYGQPLGDVDKLQEGDPIIVRTQDYWYVYHYTSYKIVLPSQVEVVAANPEHPGETPTKRMLTMTTCEPKYPRRRTAGSATPNSPTGRRSPTASHRNWPPKTPTAQSNSSTTNSRRSCRRSIR